jgi:hypothetical protein
MFRSTSAIMGLSSERVLVFIGFMGLCNDGERSSVVLIVGVIKRRGWEGGGDL